MDDYLAANRESWDARTPVHLGSRFYDVDGWLRDRPTPRARELDALGDVTGRTLVHLQCHFGLDTLQFARAGAYVVGLDFSPAAVDAARELAQRSGLDDRAEFVCADVHDAVDALGGRVFDIVYVSLGVLCWLPSVERWAEQAAALVAPGGVLYLHDGHPLAWALDDDEPRVAHTYFEEPEPYVDDAGLTYTDGATEPIPRSYEWNHGVGETVTALIRHGLRLEWLEEHDWTVFPRFPWLVERPAPTKVGGPRTERRWETPPGAPRIPLTFSLLASRPSS
ncbi:MAG: class I SAM-dependent methyltransferase [Acidimicrobiia bacterium]